MGDSRPENASFIVRALRSLFSSRGRVTALLLVQLAAALLFFWARRPVPQTIAPSLLPQEGCAYNALYGGLYIDESAGKAGTAIQSEPLALEKGVYEVTVHYSSDTGSTRCFAASSIPGAVLCDHVGLPQRGTEERFTFWVERDITDMTINVVYCGEGYFSLTDLSIAATPLGASRGAVRLLILFLVLDGLALLAPGLPALGQKRRLVLFSLALCWFLSSWPIFTNYLISGHDLAFHLQRINDIASCWAAGQFPAKISQMYLGGYGYAASIFYGDTLLAIPALLRFLGFTVTAAYQVYVAGINALTVAFAYFAFRRLGKSDWAGVVGCFLYAMAPYRLTDLYMRAAVGEYTAMAFMPLLALGMARLLTSPRNPAEGRGKTVLCIALGLTGIVQSHLLSTEMALLFMAVSVLIYLPRVFRHDTLLCLGKAALLTLLLNLWFIVPFADYFFSSNIGAFASAKFLQIQSSGASPAQLLLLFPPCTGYSSTAVGAAGEMPMNLGWGLIAGLLLYAAIAFCAEKGAGRAGRIWACLSLLALFLATYCFPYDALSTLPVLGSCIGSLQFPWRFLAPATLFAVVPALFALSYLRRERPSLFPFALALLCTLALLGGLWVENSCITQRGAHRVFSESGYDYNNQTAGGQYLPFGVNESLLVPMEALDSPGVNVTDWARRGDGYTVTCESGDGATLYLPLLAYKGYKAVCLDTGERLAVGQSDNYTLTVALPAGFSGTVYATFAEPWYWRLAEMVSLATVFALYVKRRKIKGETKQEELCRT